MVVPASGAVGENTIDFEEKQIDGGKSVWCTSEPKNKKSPFQTMLPSYSGETVCETKSSSFFLTFRNSSPSLYIYPFRLPLPPPLSTFIKVQNSNPSLISFSLSLSKKLFLYLSQHTSSCAFEVAYIDIYIGYSFIHGDLMRRSFFGSETHQTSLAWRGLSCWDLV